MASRQLHEAIPDDARAWCGIEERVEVGTAYKTILRMAAEERPDLIVMGSQARAVDRGGLLFGSTSQHVVRAATCPVLTVRPSRKAEVASFVRAGASLTVGRLGCRPGGAMLRVLLGALFDDRGWLRPPWRQDAAPCAKEPGDSIFRVVLRELPWVGGQG